MTVARALLENRVEECGGLSESSQELFDKYGLRVTYHVLHNWLKGWSAPNGNPAISDCGRFLDAPTRFYVNQWIGVKSDEWWWQLLKAEHLKEVERDDPYELLGLRPPE